MAKRRIPGYRVYEECSVECLEKVEAERKRIWREVHEKKLDFKAWFKKGICSDKVHKSYSYGPIALPLDFFVSSRWHERRTRIPLACDEESWHFAWRYWRDAESYRHIKENIETNRLWRPIYCDWFINCPPGVAWHRCFAMKCENPKWPFLVARTGNERLLMARYEWAWETIPAVVILRDCGESKLFSALLEVVARRLAEQLNGPRWLKRPHTDKGAF